MTENFYKHTGFIICLTPKQVLPGHCSYWEPQCWTGAGAADAPHTGSRMSRGDSTPVCPSSSTRRGTCGTAGRSAVWGSGRGWYLVWTAGNKAVAQEPLVVSRCSSDGVCACPRPHHCTSTRPEGQRGLGQQSHSEPDWRGMQLEVNRSKEISGIYFLEKSLRISEKAWNVLSYTHIRYILTFCSMSENIFTGLTALTPETPSVNIK